MSSIGKSTHIVQKRGVAQKPLQKNAWERGVEIIQNKLNTEIKDAKVANIIIQNKATHNNFWGALGSAADYVSTKMKNSGYIGVSQAGELIDLGTNLARSAKSISLLLQQGKQDVRDARDIIKGKKAWVIRDSVAGLGSGVGKGGYGFANSILDVGTRMIVPGAWHANVAEASHNAETWLDETYKTNNENWFNVDATSPSYRVLSDGSQTLVNAVLIAESGYKGINKAKAVKAAKKAKATSALNDLNAAGGIPLKASIKVTHAYSPKIHPVGGNPKPVKTKPYSPIPAAKPFVPLVTVVGVSSQIIAPQGKVKLYPANKHNVPEDRKFGPLKDRQTAHMGRQKINTHPDGEPEFVGNNSGIEPQAIADFKRVPERSYSFEPSRANLSQHKEIWKDFETSNYGLDAASVKELRDWSMHKYFDTPQHLVDTYKDIQRVTEDTNVTTSEVIYMTKFSFVAGRLNVTMAFNRAKALKAAILKSPFADRMSFSNFNDFISPTDKHFKVGALPTELVKKVEIRFTALDKYILEQHPIDYVLLELGMRDPKITLDQAAKNIAQLYTEASKAGLGDKEIFNINIHQNTYKTTAIDAVEQYKFGLKIKEGRAKLKDGAKEQRKEYKALNGVEDYFYRIQNHETASPKIDVNSPNAIEYCFASYKKFTAYQDKIWSFYKQIGEPAKNYDFKFNDTLSVEQNIQNHIKANDHDIKLYNLCAERGGEFNQDVNIMDVYNPDASLEANLAILKEHINVKPKNIARDHYLYGDDAFTIESAGSGQPFETLKKLKQYIVQNTGTRRETALKELKQKTRGVHDKTSALKELFIKAGIE